MHRPLVKSLLLSIILVMQTDTTTCTDTTDNIANQLNTSFACTNGTFFRTPLTIWQPEPISAQFSFLLQLKVLYASDDIENLTQLRNDVRRICQERHVVNCDSVMDVIGAQYHDFIQSLGDIPSNYRDCVSVPTIDLGFYSRLHRRTDVSDINNDNKDETVCDVCVQSNLGKAKTRSGDDSTANEVTGAGNIRSDTSRNTSMDTGVSYSSGSDYDRTPAISVVSGYWSTARNKYQHNDHGCPDGSCGSHENTTDVKNPYEVWLPRTLRIAMPYIVFTDEAHVPLIRSSRRGLPTLIALRNQSSFLVKSSHSSVVGTFVRSDDGGGDGGGVEADKLNGNSRPELPIFPDAWTHPEHVPSVAVASIWLEKVNLLLIASKLTNSTYYAWVDAGISSFRPEGPVNTCTAGMPNTYSPTSSPSCSTPPPPPPVVVPSEPWSVDVVLSLPRTRVSYAHVHGSYHSFAGGVIILHRDLIPMIHSLFYEEYAHCHSTIRDWRCGSEQFLFSEIKRKMPHLFHAMSYEYGDIDFLWANKYYRKI